MVLVEFHEVFSSDETRRSCGGNSISSLICGQMIHFDEHFFQMSWNHELVLLLVLRWTCSVPFLASFEPSSSQKSPLMCQFCVIIVSKNSCLSRNRWTKVANEKGDLLWVAQPVMSNSNRDKNWEQLLLLCTTCLGRNPPNISHSAFQSGRMIHSSNFFYGTANILWVHPFYPNSYLPKSTEWNFFFCHFLHKDKRQNLSKHHDRFNLFHIKHHRLIDLFLIL